MGLNTLIRFSLNFLVSLLLILGYVAVGALVFVKLEEENERNKTERASVMLEVKTGRVKLISPLIPLPLYHYGVTMSLYLMCKQSCTLAITRYTASLSRHALSYFHFHLSLVTLHLLLDTLLSLTAYTMHILIIISLCFCCCIRSCCLSFSSTLPSVVY
eukprot:sb/3472935/